MPRSREACEPHSGVHEPQLQVRVPQQKIVHDEVKILHVQLRDHDAVKILRVQLSPDSQINRYIFFNPLKGKEESWEFTKTTKKKLPETGGETHPGVMDFMFEAFCKEITVDQ